MRTVQAGEYTFVTNNRTDFAALYTQEELHAGLVIIVPNVPPAQQRALFQAARVWFPCWTNSQGFVTTSCRRIAC